MVRVSNRGSVRFLNLIIHYVNGEIFGTEKRWSVFRDGPLCEAVRYRVTTVVCVNIPTCTLLQAILGYRFVSIFVLVYYHRLS